jgi:hypothetical protein
MKRILAAAAAAALTTLSLAGPGLVSAGASSQATAGHIFKRYTRGTAGYVMTGGTWRFRYIETTLTMPACQTRATHANIALESDEGEVVLWVGCDGGAGSIRYGTVPFWDSAQPLDLSPNVGDQLTISIYSNQQPPAEDDRFTAVDHTQGVSATVHISGGGVWLQAQVLGEGPRWSLASTTARLWAFHDTRLTSARGTHGTILGPWPTILRLIGTRGGRSTGTVVLRPTYPWNHGHNFGVWWRAAS